MRTVRLELYTGYSKPVEPDERRRFRELVLRRSRREPVAYLLGEKEFYSLSFRVTPEVLIPRPETERVVEVALEVLDRAVSRPPPRILDLGTGSGNIAVALATERPDALIDAVDSSREALEVARSNARRHSVDSRIRFYHGDLFEPLRRLPQGFAIVVSNPPYVRAAEMNTLMPDVRLHEPRLALLDSKSPLGDGLGFYRAIAGEVGRYLDPDGAVVVEVGDGQAGSVSEIFRESALAAVDTARDYGGVERVVVARRRRS